MNKISGLNPTQINKGTSALLKFAKKSDDDLVFDQLDAVMKAPDNKVMKKLDQVGKHLDKKAKYTDPLEGSWRRALSEGGKSALGLGVIGAGTGAVRGALHDQPLEGSLIGGGVLGGIGGLLGAYRGFTKESPEDYFLRLNNTNHNEAKGMYAQYLAQKRNKNMKIMNQHPHLDYVRPVFERDF